MNRLVLLISLFLIVTGHSVLAQRPRPDSLRPPLTDVQRQQDSLYADRLAAERERVIKELKTASPGSGNVAISGITWQERGPSNSGGRVSALLFDPNDPAQKKVWTASLKGGS